MSVELVPNRECGSCTVCCEVPIIDVPELQKPPGVRCTHCTQGSGCQIYEARPEVCRSHYCGWRHFALLDDSWRPDRSNIFIELKTLPSDEYCGFAPTHPAGLRITLLGPLRAEHQELLDGNIAALVVGDIPVVLTVAAPPEQTRGALLLNPMLKPYPITHPAFAATLAIAQRACQEIPAEPFTFG